jgi:surfeit locus 1 family protein
VTVPEPLPDTGEARRSPLVAGLATLAAILVLIALGTWQLERRAWKHAILERIAAHMASPPVDLPDEISTPADWDYRPVQVTGRLLHDREMPLSARSYQGSIGYQIVTPLQRSDGAGAVLVNRGWVPVDKLDPAARPGSQPDGEVTVTGIARVPAIGGWMAPDNRPADNVWYSVDFAAMAAHAGLPAVAPVVVEAGPTAPGTLPVGGQTNVNIADNHLQYALTWYSLAIVAAVMYGASHWRGRRPGA